MNFFNGWQLVEIPTLDETLKTQMWHVYPWNINYNQSNW